MLDICQVPGRWEKSINSKPDDVESLRRVITELERQLDAVRCIAVNLSSAMEVKELVREALNTVLLLSHAEAGSILLYHPAKKKLVFEYVVGEKANELTGVKLEPDQGLAGAVFQSGKTLVSEDVGAERAHLRELGEKIGYVTQNMVTIPLKAAETQPLGVMQVLNKRGAEFDEYDIQLMEIIAAQIAVAIKAVRLHEEARLAMVVRFIGNISHDVKNMVTPAIIGAGTLELVARESFREFDECLNRTEQPGEQTPKLAGSLAKLRKIYPDIVEMVREGCEAVQQRMAQISAAVKGRISHPHFETADILSIARRVGSMLNPQAEQKGVKLTIEADRELPPAVVDGKQIYNAVYNLILNAIDACSAGDAITFRCDCRAGGEFPGGNYLLLECADTGPGIPDQVKARLFTDEAVSTKPLGTGLGTRIVKDVADAHGGTVEVQSKVGAGTTFRCRIPLERPCEEAGVAA
jgi:signal transduction histidine kinase